jgi:hypothetical protein
VQRRRYGTLNRAVRTIGRVNVITFSLELAKIVSALVMAGGIAATWTAAAKNVNDAKNLDHPKVKAEFEHPSIGFVQGSFTDLDKVERALEGVCGAYINTDGFTVGRASGDYPPANR